MPARKERALLGARKRVAGAQIAEIQRSRLLAAAVAAVDELGYAGATVAHITSRARVSRRTFYELFANREECLVAVLEDVLAQVGGEIAAARLDGLAWRERVRMGLWVILSFFDREPALARLCVVYSAQGGPVVVERREAILGCLVAVIDGGRAGRARSDGCTRLTAEGLVGAGVAIVSARLPKGEREVLKGKRGQISRERPAFKGEREQLGGLLGELMGMIVLPYEGPAAARREQSRRAPRALPDFARESQGVAGGDVLEGVQMRLTYRTARVLEGIARHPGASNRVIADRAEIQDQGQVSKLLARLERLGLLQNTGIGHSKGEPNAWALTSKGERVAHSIRLHAKNSEREAA